MQATVPTLSMAFMAADILLGIAVPLAMYLFFRKKYACGRLPFFVGCAVMLVFALTDITCFIPIPGRKSAIWRGAGTDTRFFQPCWSWAGCSNAGRTGEFTSKNWPLPWRV